MAFDWFNHRFVLSLMVLLIATDAIGDPCQICPANGDSCYEFDQWRDVLASGLAVDSRRIRRIGSGLGALAEYEPDPSRFNEASVVKQAPISTEIDQGVDDGFRIVVQSLCLLRATESERFHQKRSIL
jgi:hypothetical protein